MGEKVESVEVASFCCVESSRVEQQNQRQDKKGKQNENERR